MPSFSAPSDVRSVNETFPLKANPRFYFHKYIIFKESNEDFFFEIGGYNTNAHEYIEEIVLGYRQIQDIYLSPVT